MNLKAFLYNIYLDFLSFFRLKIAVFFSLVFPIMLFVIFSSIWGEQDKSYIFFILTGIICLMTISEGLFSIGPIVKDYYSSGWIKYIKQLPLDSSFFFISFIISRLIFFQIIVFILFIIAYFLFNYNAFNSYGVILLGSVFGFFLFSLLGLCVSFLSRRSSGRTLSNMVYFILIFVSDIFYSISGNGNIVKKINLFLPVNDLVYFMRGQEYRLHIILIWIVMLIVLFKFLFKNISSHR